jgi:cytoskeletal protein RodZ
MGSFGDNLRRERELRGVNLREIAESTKISVRFLQALEEDRIELLPGGIFPRSFVRQYARALGLDAERYVAEFLYAHGGLRPEPPASSPKPRPRSRPRSRVPFVVAALIAGGVALTLARGGAERAERVASTPAPVPAAPLPADRVYPPPEPEGAPQQVEPEGLTLQLSADQTCWVAVQVDGQTVLNRVLNQGESETLSADGEIVLSVGNAGGISFRVNDRPGVPLGRSGEVRKNIVITKQNLRSLVEDAPRVRASHSS